MEIISLLIPFPNFMIILMNLPDIRLWSPGSRAKRFGRMIFIARAGALDPDLFDSGSTIPVIRSGMPWCCIRRRAGQDRGNS